MGRRFPEFCILRAACRVSVKASSSTTGDNRVALYQAAIDAVAVQHYADWPFMVEVLNKWLEMNQDFVRDPIGYVAPNSPPGPASPTIKDHSPAISTIHNAPSQITTPGALISGHRLIQSPNIMTDNVPFPLSNDAEVLEHVAGSSPAASKTGTETNDLDGHPSPLDSERGVPMSIQKLLPLSWIRALRLLPPLGSFGVGPLPFRNTSSASRSWLTAPVPSAHQMFNSPKTCWLRPPSLADLYKRWWDVLEKTFTFMSG
jgi:hypothetical protein